ncbi:hypothetical protein [[Clostridium] polysaccharolyticum]|uniref:FtsX-like permease family protein n=1 Tax=[Clostridium] polysaccharolyticum TaxID=29364 RepID=A0A1I0ERL9_9FIRM|nr:hypothetical protein [[Clostridium] polysaccharolyticum]SET48064.1 hypothetical protein SAMN04487772_12418 [[Clostridium] polysaccharolyticum]
MLLSKERKAYIKLAQLIICNNKGLFVLFTVAAIIGFTFLFTITSLSETIIQTRQDIAIEKYGKFLAIISDVSETLMKEVKEKNRKFDFECYGVGGNIEKSGKRVTYGSMDQKMGDIFGFKLLDGKWPQTSRQIVVEEYVLYLFGIQNKKLPVTISMVRDGQSVKYDVVGIVSNYSYTLVDRVDSTQNTKTYPSIIFAKGQLKNEKTSLVILQKKLNFKTYQEDMDSVLMKDYNEDLTNDNVCMNGDWGNEGYKNNEDMIEAGVVYLILLNLLLILELIIMIRVIITRNKKTLSLFEVFGLLEKQRKKVILYAMGKVIIIGLTAGVLLSILIGLIYADKAFFQYNRYYNSALIKNVMIELVLTGCITLGVYILCGRNQKSSIIEKITNTGFDQKQRNYKFKKIDGCIVCMQAICMFFFIASMNFTEMFHFDQNQIDYSLYSKRVESYLSLNGYDIVRYRDSFFPFPSLDEFKGYGENITLTTEAETKHSLLLIETDRIDQYFKEWCVTEDRELSSEKQRMWNQIADEAGKYRPIEALSANVKVLPQKEFCHFLQQKGIVNRTLEHNEKQACVLLLPEYKQKSSKPSLKEKESLYLGRVQSNKDKLEFVKEAFKIEAVLSCSSKESSSIKIIMSETVAKRSKLVVGYNTINIVMKPNTPLSVQKEIEQKVSLLMASIQGGMLDSSVSRNEEDKLMGNYTSLLSNSILLFGFLAICIYIIFNSYIEWEKYRYEYGVLRSFGMSYSTLQHKLFLRYSYSIIIASIISILLGNQAFPNGMLTIQQIIISSASTILITYVCRIAVYYWNRNKSISSMLYSSI